MNDLARLRFVLWIIAAILALQATMEFIGQFVAITPRPAFVLNLRTAGEEAAARYLQHETTSPMIPSLILFVVFFAVIIVVAQSLGEGKPRDKGSRPEP